MDKLLLIAQFSPSDVGTHLELAAREAGISVEQIDSSEGFGRLRSYRRIARKILGDWPQHALRFNRRVRRRLEGGDIRWLLTSGKAPVLARTVRHASSLGVRTINYLTDDPSNPSIGTWWYRRALVDYSVLASPRSATLQELSLQFGGDVRHVQFGYGSKAHFPATGIAEDEGDGDVLFVGYGDRDRIPFFLALHRAGIRPVLFGGGWERNRVLRAYYRGMADLEQQRALYSSVPVSICLVRRANRDEHVMRTFEAAAMGACLLMESTSEHREIFGPDGECVLYFDSLSSMVKACERLLADEALRQELRANVLRRMRLGSHTYGDRLARILAD